MTTAAAYALRHRVQHDSYLYPGFRAVVFLPSIQRQRFLQSQLLARLHHPPESVLFVGCGFGDEMAYLIEAGLTHARHILAIDITDVTGDVHKNAARVGKHISFAVCDLLDLPYAVTPSSVDLVQAGFVFHDLADNEKDDGFAAAASVLKNGGYMLLSDFFPDVPLSPQELYQPFIDEADRQVSFGRMPATARDEFLGDGRSPGLLQTIRDAAAGERDFFESADAAISRAFSHGLRLVEACQNSLSQHLRVLLFQKIQTGERNVLFAF